MTFQVDQALRHPYKFKIFYFILPRRKNIPKMYFFYSFYLLKEGGHILTHILRDKGKIHPVRSKVKRQKWS